MSGVFIAFEGGDASGKTTQARRIAAGRGALFTREPGGTELGEMLRDLVLEPAASVNLRAEALMIAAARAQHVAEVVRPALARGRDVVTDRFTASSLAYQGFGSGLEIAAVRGLSEFATDGLIPHVTVLIDVPVEVAARRFEETRDRFEREDGQFHERVRQGYLELAATNAAWVVVDGAGTLQEVAELVDAALESALSA